MTEDNGLIKEVSGCSEIETKSDTWAGLRDRTAPASVAWNKKLGPSEAKVFRLRVARPSDQ